MTAEQGRINGDEVPDREVGDHRTHLDHLATELVAGNDRVAGRRELAAEDMNIRAADAAGFHLDDRVELAWARVVDGPHGKLPGLLDHHRLHFPAPIDRPLMGCLCAIHTARRTGRLYRVAAAAGLA